MNEVLLIRTKCLKDLLHLFNTDDELANLALGDTWHPSSGFVDESVLNGKTKVKEILDFPYEFKGLVGFKASVGHININLVTYPNEDRDHEEYEITGPKKEIRILNNKILELNAYSPGKYQTQALKNGINES